LGRKLKPRKQLTALKGVYALIIEVERTLCVKVGALGRIEFEEGQYVYVGSAQKGLKARINRHLRKQKAKFWHIDYLLEKEQAKVVKVLYSQASKEEECIIAKKIAEENKAVAGFGCSDCRCKSHLFRLEHDWRCPQVFDHEFSF
jgi:Uri superfamily endonuclease